MEKRDHMIKSKILPKSFFTRDASVVARELLGKILVHESREGKTAGKIVETEAYYGSRDPASRAFRRTPMSEIMWAEGGTTFIYMVHGLWLFNIITAREGEPSAVLIRALEPLEEIELMKKRRGTADIKNLCSGPGKLTEAMEITKKLHNIDIAASKELFVLNSKEKVKIGSSNRIGVDGRDLKKKLRFFVDDNKFVSR